MRITPFFLALVLLLWLALPSLSPGLIGVFVTIALYAPIVIGLSMLTGYTGQVSLGQAALFGLGAYINGIFIVHMGINPWLAYPSAVALTALVAYLIGRPVLMLRGHFLAIATLGFNIIVEVLMREVKDLTGGPSGLSGITSLRFGDLSSDIFYFYAATLLTIAAILLSGNLVRSRIGRALQAIKGSEMAASSLGVDAGHYKSMIFAWSAALAAASGALYSGWLGFISPSSFDLGFSVMLLTMTVLGGAASIPGAIAGAALLELLRQAIKDLAQAIAGGSPEYEIVVFGALLVGVMMFAPEGLWPRLVSFLPRAKKPAPVAAAVRAPVLHNSPAQSEPSVVLEVRNVSRSFGGLMAVKDISFHVNTGEIFAIIGPNGAGKTTLLNLISGVITPTSGTIWIAGRRVPAGRAERVATMGVARTFQTPKMFTLMDVADNVKVGLHKLARSGFLRSAVGFARKEEAWLERQALQVLAIVGACQQAFASTANLPFGSQRLVELARALAAQPRLLLLDEPASGLSEAERRSFMQILKEVRARGTTVVLVEHNVNMVMELADRVAVLHHGELLSQGKPAEILRDRRVIEAYLGEGHDRPVHQRSSREGVAFSKLLEISDLRASYGNIPVLHGIDLEVAQGEVVAVLGRNGAGKSTLMKAIVGLIPCSGSLTFDGVSIEGRTPEWLAARGLVLVPERRQLLETMTVEDHLILGAYRRYGHDGKDDIRHDLERCYSLFPILRQRRLQIARSLSGGQQQMLAIARALMAHPKLLLLDEPLLGLAPKVVDDVLQAIETLADGGIGVLISEQNVGAITRIADRAYVLENGRIVMADKAANLIGSPDLEAAFLGADVASRTAEHMAGQQGAD